MNFDVNARTILSVKHGSHAYGTNIATSDVDIKGICIEPLNHHLGFLHCFEQHERLASKGHDADLVIYSLKKFAKLAAECNPNIIEVLHVADDDVIYIDEFGERLRSLANDFLSTRARFTFAGYAHAQLKRIKTHRDWLLNPPKSPPDRKEFGLPDEVKASKSELGAFDATLEQGIEIELPKEVLTLFVREKQYQSAKMKWKQFEDWKVNRNCERAKLEAKFGYDTKHGMHLIRLLRMCKEILNDGKVHVKRHDAEELLRIRAGEWDYDRLIKEAESLDSECEALYKTSALPRESNRTKINAEIVQLTWDYCRAKGL